MVKDTDIAWLAAAFDGEGNLCLYPQTQRGYRTYRPVFVVKNTNKEFVIKATKICMDLGASSIKVYKAKRKDNVSPFTGREYKDDYILQVRGQGSVSKILRPLLPWLIIKREFATDLVNYLDAIKDRSTARRQIEPWETKEAERIRAAHMPRSKQTDHAIGEPPVNDEGIPSQAEQSASSSSEGVETTTVRNASNNPSQECPGSLSFPPRVSRIYKLMDREIVRSSDENRSLDINNRDSQN